MEVLRTARLRLSTREAQDAEAFRALNDDARDDPRVTQFLPGRVGLAQAEAFVAAQQELYARSGACYFKATLRETGALAGFVGLRRIDAGLPFAPCTDIGWRLAAPFWGQGYAGETARACLAHGFGPLDLEEIVSFTVPANLRSRAVMEKPGMCEDPAGAFAHPALAPGHHLSRRLLYRLRRPAHGTGGT